MAPRFTCHSSLHPMFALCLPFQMRNCAKLVKCHTHYMLTGTRSFCGTVDLVPEPASFMGMPRSPSVRCAQIKSLLISY